LVVLPSRIKTRQAVDGQTQWTCQEESNRRRENALAAISDLVTARREDFSSPL